MRLKRCVVWIEFVLVFMYNDESFEELILDSVSNHTNSSEQIYYKIELMFIFLVIQLQMALLLHLFNLLHRFLIFKKNVVRILVCVIPFDKWLVELVVFDVCLRTDFFYFKIVHSCSCLYLQHQAIQ